MDGFEKQPVVILYVKQFERQTSGITATVKSDCFDTPF